MVFHKSLSNDCKSADSATAARPLSPSAMSHEEKIALLFLEARKLFDGYHAYVWLSCFNSETKQEDNLAGIHDAFNKLCSDNKFLFFFEMWYVANRRYVKVKKMADENFTDDEKQALIDFFNPYIMRGPKDKNHDRVSFFEPNNHNDAKNALDTTVSDPTLTSAATSHTGSAIPSVTSHSVFAVAPIGMYDSNGKPVVDSACSTTFHK